MGLQTEIDFAGMDVVANSFRTTATKNTQQGVRYFFGNGQTPFSSNNAGNNTLTAAQILTGIYVRDCNGLARTDTLDTAANIVAALKAASSGVSVGDVIYLDVINGTNAALAITIAAGTGGAFDANQAAAARTIGQNQSKCMSIRLTNVTPGSEAYVVYC